jgi:hypothetical protein
MISPFGPLYVGNRGKLLKPTKKLYPYDSVFGWRYLNYAKSVYLKQRQVKFQG